ncbi:MAG: hypothetical protein WA446_13660 [Steroidobacteraceae bacterium]
MLWDRIVTRWWSLQGGARYDFGGGSGKGWAPPMALRRSIAMEYLLTVAVLATTAVLTTFHSP